MILSSYSKTYENWAPVIGRVLIAAVFLAGAWFKIPGTNSASQEVTFTAAAGVPLPQISVFLAFILEVVTAVALIVGWRTKLIANILVWYTVLLTLIFHLKFSTPQDFGMFINHLALIGGLLYVSVYGAGRIAISKIS